MNPEVIKDILYYNFSSRNLEEVHHWFPAHLKPGKVVLLPDLNPGKSPLPTGCHVEIDIRNQPRWREFTLSDIGCGMQVLQSSLTWSDFDYSKDSWIQVYNLLKANKGKLGDLGGGNHFVDAAVDSTETVFFVIHTGSRSESPMVERWIDEPRKYDLEYTRVVSWARQNRDKIREVLESVYGTTNLILDKTHNLYTKEGRTAKIYKGAVELKPGETTIIPSSMAGEMALVTGTDALSEINFAMSHGTGRIKSRSASKKEAESYDFNALRELIFIPKQISDRAILTDNPTCYRKLDDCLQLLEGLINITNRLYPIAYLGQI